RGDLTVLVSEPVAGRRPAPYRLSEIVSGICYEMRVTPEHLPRSEEALFRVEMPVRSWLETVLAWGRGFHQLVASVMAEVRANPTNAATETAAAAVRELERFLADFPNREPRIVSLISSS